MTLFGLNELHVITVVICVHNNLTLSTSNCTLHLLKQLMKTLNAVRLNKCAFAPQLTSLPFWVLLEMYFSFFPPTRFTSTICSPDSKDQNVVLVEECSNSHTTEQFCSLHQHTLLFLSIFTVQTSCEKK